MNAFLSWIASGVRKHSHAVAKKLRKSMINRNPSTFITVPLVNHFTNVLCANTAFIKMISIPVPVNHIIIHHAPTCCVSNGSQINEFLCYCGIGVIRISEIDSGRAAAAPISSADTAASPPSTSHSLRLTRSKAAARGRLFCACYRVAAYFLMTEAFTSFSTSAPRRTIRVGACWMP